MDHDTRTRLLTLTDGVFAIAITLLGLDLVPHIPEAVRGAALAQALIDMAPRLATYGLSFYIIGRFWDAHRTYFRHIQFADSRVVMINLTGLLWITLIPASADLIGEHLEDGLAVCLYSLNLLLTVISLWGLWRYAASAGYLPTNRLDTPTAHFIDVYAGLTVLGFALAIACAFVAPELAMVLVLVTTVFARTAAEHVAGSDEDADRLPLA